MDKTGLPSSWNSNLNVEHILGKVLKYWYLFVLCLVIFPLFVKFHLKYTAPQYKVNAILMIEDNSNSSSGSAGGATNLGDFNSLLSIKSKVDNEVLVLQTADLMESVVKDLNLNITYLQKQLMGFKELYSDCPFYLVPNPLNYSLSSNTGTFYAQLLPGNKYLLEVRNGKEVLKKYTGNLGDSLKTAIGSFLVKPNINISINGKKDEDPQEFLIMVNDLSGTVAQYRAGLSIANVDKQSDAIRMELSTSIPQKGVDILNRLITDYSYNSLSQKNAFADSTINFIDKRLNLVTHDLNSAEQNVQNFLQFNQLADIQSQSSLAVTNASELDKNLNQTEVQIKVVDEMLAIVRDGKNARPVPSLITSPDPTFSVLLEKYNTLLMNRDKLLLGSTENNPVVIHVEQQITVARKDLVNSLENLKRVLTITEQKLASQSSAIKSQIQGTPSKQRQFLDLSRQQEIKQGLFQYLLQKREEMQITKASNILGSRVIDRPKSDVAPYAPNSKNQYTMAYFLAIALPLGLLVLGDVLNKKITTIKEVSDKKVAEIVGEISDMGSHVEDIDFSQSRSIVAEQFRSMRANVQFTLGRKDTPVILFTSSISGEGKSYLSLNLAKTFSSLGKKVVMLDLDLRKPKLAKNLGMDNSVGFSNFVVSQMSVSDVIKHTELPLLDVVLSGPMPPNPSELLQDERTEELISELKKQYDLVIIDSSPIGLVSDAQLLAPYADSILYVIRLNYTLKEHLNFVHNLKASGKVKNLYFVLNGIGKGAGGGYNYTYKYGYGSYGSYADDNKKSFFRRILGK